MTLDTRSILSTLSLPIIFISLAFVAAPRMDLSPSSLMGELYPYLPYLLCITGMILGWIFHLSREFSQLLLIGLIFGLVYSVIWQNNAGDIHTPLLYQLLCLMLPVNFIINQQMQNRGIWNRYGIQRLFLIAVQLLIVALLVKYPPGFIVDLLGFRFSDRLAIATDISQLVLLFAAGTAIFFSLQHFLQPSLLNAGNLGGFIICIVGMHYIRQPQLLALFFIVAALIIISTIMLNAYHLAYRDELTSLPSRRALKQSMLALSDSYCIAMVDVDHFKKLNDNYGHDVGDQVLRMLASHLRTVRNGKAFRYGGEEFTLLFPEQEKETALEYCEQLCGRIASSPFVIRSAYRPKQRPGELTKKQKGQQQLKVTVSIGLCEKSDKYLDSDEVIKAADKALYKAKKNGRNQVALIM